MSRHSWALIETRLNATRRCGNKLGRCTIRTGGQINDIHNDEPDGLDETWALYDRELIDDELYAMWSHFRPGGGIFILSDSCIAAP